MKLMITLISSILLMIQMPIQAEEGHSDMPGRTTISIVDLNVLINNYKSALKYQWDNTITLSANELLNVYKNTNDTELKVKITDALLLKDKDGWTFLHWYSMLGLNKGILNTTIDVLKDRPKLLEKLLIAVNDNGDNFLHVAAQSGHNDLIVNAHNSLKKNFSPQFINDTELFSLKSRIIYLKNSIHNTVINIYIEIFD